MKRKKQRSPRVVGAIALAISLAVTLVIFSNLYRKPFEGGKQTVTVDFERAPQLYSGDQVRLNGDISGKVTQVKPGPEAGQARATLEIDKEAGKIYANATADMKALTLLGGKYYVDIVRGTKNAGLLGDDVIPVERTHVQVELEDVTDAFRDNALSGFQALPGETAKALSDPNAPADALKELSTSSDDIVDATQAVQGLRPGYSLPQLIRSTESTVTALDNAGNDDLRRLVEGAAATLQVTADRDQEIQQILEVTPRLSANLTTTLAKLETTADLFNDNVGQLSRSVSDLGPTLTGLNPTLVEFNKISPKLPRLFTDVESLFTNLEGVPVVTKALNELSPSLRKLDKTVLPYLNEPDKGTGVPTSTMIGGAAAGLGAIAALQDENGRYVRFPASVGPTSVYLPCSSSLIDANAEGLLACDNINDALTSYLGYFPNAADQPQTSQRKGSK